MVNVGTGTAGTRFLNKNWPVTDGLIAGTTTQTGHKEKLEPEQGSLIPDREKVGID